LVGLFCFFLFFVLWAFGWQHLHYYLQNYLFILYYFKIPKQFTHVVYFFKVYTRSACMHHKSIRRKVPEVYARYRAYTFAVTWSACKVPKTSYQSRKKKKKKKKKTAMGAFASKKINDFFDRPEAGKILSQKSEFLELTARCHFSPFGQDGNLPTTVANSQCVLCPAACSKPRG